jgi:DNA-binding transcriptional LysR family regulator
LVDSILAARSLRRRIVLVLPNSASVPSVVTGTDLIVTLPSRIVQAFEGVPQLRIMPAPLPAVEVSPHLFWHPRTQGSPLRAWLRNVISELAKKPQKSIVC